MYTPNTHNSAIKRHLIQTCVQQRDRRTSAWSCQCRDCVRMFREGLLPGENPHMDHMQTCTQKGFSHHTFHLQFNRSGNRKNFLSPLHKATSPTGFVVLCVCTGHSWFLLLNKGLNRFTSMYLKKLTHQWSLVSLTALQHFAICIESITGL